jgi:hypothetical protein
MKHILFKGTIATIFSIALLYFTTANAENQTNTTAKVNMTASKGPGNATAKLNMTILKVLANTTAKLNMTASKGPGNATAKVNQTSLSAMENASAKAEQSASKAAGNASAELNKTASELGKNASKVGGALLNKTQDLGKKIAVDLGSLLGNASEKLKQDSK